MHVRSSGYWNQNPNVLFLTFLTYFVFDLQYKSVTSCFLNKKFVFVFQPGLGNRIKPDQLRFVLLKNHSIYPNPNQGTKIRKFGRVIYLRSTLNSLNSTCNANL